MTSEQDGSISPNPGRGEDHDVVQSTTKRDQLRNMSVNSDLKKKAPILTVAMGLIASSGELLTSGTYVEGGLLMAAGIGCIVVYEQYQVKQLPDAVDQGMIEDIADEAADQINSQIEKQNSDDDDPSPAELTE